MARDFLASIYGKRITITGEFVSCGNLAWQKTMLLRNIKNDNGKVITDHLWILLKDFQSGMKFRRNKMVKVTGNVIHYARDDGVDFSIEPEIIEI